MNAREWSSELAKVMTAEVVPRRTVVTEVPLRAPVEPAPVGVLPVGRDRTHPSRGVPAAVETRTVVEPMTSTETRMHVTVSPALGVARTG
jgi:hypothetical protein